MSASTSDATKAEVLPKKWNTHPLFHIYECLRLTYAAFATLGTAC